MMALVTGGVRSGKSAFAERMVELCAQRTGGSRYYLATMRVCDAESEERVRRHQARRAGRSYRTFECGDGLLEVASAAAAEPGGRRVTALLDDLAGLMTSELYGPSFELRDLEGVYGRIMHAVDTLRASCGDLVVVTGEVGSDGIAYDPSTDAYVRLAGRLGCTLAARADCVLEVSCGCALSLKAPSGGPVGGLLGELGVRPVTVTGEAP